MDPYFLKYPGGGHYYEECDIHYPKRDGGSRYLLRLDVNESDFPKEAQASTLPGTAGQRLVMSVDVALASRVLSGQSKGLSQSAIDACWNDAIKKQFGVDGAEAVRIRRLINGM